MFGYDKVAPQLLTSYEIFIHQTAIQLHVVHLLEKYILTLKVTYMHVIYHKRGLKLINLLVSG
jgi:hypothetical protein